MLYAASLLDGPRRMKATTSRQLSAIYCTRGSTSAIARATRSSQRAVVDKVSRWYATNDDGAILDVVKKRGMAEVAPSISPRKDVSFAPVLRIRSREEMTT
jgi:hypothetical protein